MLPTTNQATSLEVEGDTTVEVTGVDGMGNPAEVTDHEPEKQTTDTQTEEEKSEPSEEQSVSSKDQELSGKDRYARRTEKLIDALKEKTDETSILRKQLDEMRKVSSKEEEPQLPPWVNVPVPQGEITIEDYKGEVASAARNLVKAELGSFQEKVLKYETFKDDLAKVESKYPILNQDSDVFDKKKAEDIAKLYQKASAGDPTLRLSDFVDSIMSFHEAGQNSGKEEMKASVIRKDAESAVTPNPITEMSERKSDDWDSMTLKQKEEWMRSNGIWD